MDNTAVSSLLATASREKQLSATSIQAIATPIKFSREAVIVRVQFGSLSSGRRAFAWAISSALSSWSA